MTIHMAFYPRDDIDRPYVLRKEGRRIHEKEQRQIIVTRNST